MCELYLVTRPVFTGKMSSKLEVTPEPEWSPGARMKDIYDNGLANTHVLHVHDTDYSINAAVLHAALPNIPVDKWEETFSQISSDMVEDILRFCYYCEMTVTMSKMKEILCASKVLQLSCLQSACEQFVTLKLKPENYISWLEFSERENFQYLTDVCQSRMVLELYKVIQCREFKELSFAGIKDIIRRQSHQVDECFHAILSWVLTDDDRFKHVEELIDLIDIRKCSRECLQKAFAEPYENAFQTLSLQKKLNKAILCGSPLYRSRTRRTIKGIRYVPNEDETSFREDHLLSCETECIADFATSMIAAVRRFYANTLHTDITLQLSDGDTIKAHQVVLAASSVYFEALLRRSREEHTRQTSFHNINTELSHLDSGVVRALVGYMYTHRIEIEDNALLDHIHGCDFLQLENLLHRCKEYAENSQTLTISPENCFQWFIGSKLFKLPKTENKAFTFICKNFQNVHHMEGLLNLAHEDMVRMLNEHILPSIPEQVLYEVIVRWIMHNKSDRRCHLTTFLKSRAVKNCSVNRKLDVRYILSGDHFDVSEVHQIWEAHYARLAEDFEDRSLDYYKAAQDVHTLRSQLAEAAKKDSQTLWQRIKKKKIAAMYFFVLHFDYKGGLFDYTI